MNTTPLETSVEAAVPERERDDLVTVGAAAYLDEQIPGESQGYWTWFLINNRREDRNAAYRIPFTRRRGRVLYSERNLSSFVEFEKHRRLAGHKFDGRVADVMMAYGIGTPSGGPYGRKLDCRLTAQLNESGPHVQLVLNDPLMVFYLPPAQVAELASRFTDLLHEMKELTRHE